MHKDDMAWIVEELAEDLYWDFVHGVFQCIFCGATREGEHNVHCMVSRATRIRDGAND